MEVRFKALDKVVKRGEIARIEVWTYRPAQENFLGVEEADLPSQTPKEPTGEMMLTVGVLTGGERVWTRRCGPGLLPRGVPLCSPDGAKQTAR